jgi:hypothetical protein
MCKKPETILQNKKYSEKFQSKKAMLFLVTWSVMYDRVKNIYNLEVKFIYAFIFNNALQMPKLIFCYKRIKNE